MARGSVLSPSSLSLVLLASAAFLLSVTQHVSANGLTAQSASASAYSLVLHAYDPAIFRNDGVQINMPFSTTATQKLHTHKVALASEYFSPNINTLAKLLQLPESLAGVTLLAFGNGAPDLFSTFSAVRAGSGALAIGELVGSASFIVGVVLSSTTFVSPTYQVSSIPYLRELCFFAATIGMVAVIVLSEKLTQTLAICMVGLYTMYVIAVVLTTYYEGKYSYAELSASAEYLDDTALATYQHVPDEIVALGDESRYSFQQHIATRDGTGASMQPRPVWAHSTASLVSGSRKRQWHRRRQTTSATYANFEYSDMWALDTLKGSTSVKALGGFLNQHRRSLLAAAECSELLDEAHETEAADRRNLSLGDADETSPLQSAQYDQEPSVYGSMQNTLPAFNASNRHEFDSMHRNIVRSPQPQSQPQALPLPQPHWDNYTMRGAGSVSTKNSNNTRKIIQPYREISLVSSAQCSESDELSPHYLHIAKLSSGNAQTKLKKSSAQANSQSSCISPILPSVDHDNPSSDLLQNQRSNSHIDLSSAGSVGSHPDRQPDSGQQSNAIPSTPQSLHAALASASGVALTEQWQAPPASVSTQEGISKEYSHITAISHVCIPTLHYWRPEASAKLKAFIAFSALPVFLLTLTVPVSICIPDSSDENANSGGSDQHCISNDGTNECGYEEQAIDHWPTREQSTCSQRRESNVIFSHGSPTYRRSASAPELAEMPLISTPSNDQQCSKKPIKRAISASCRTSSLGSANIRWAEGAASYMRSAMSVIFLCHAAYYSGYIFPEVDYKTQHIMGFVFAITSILGNYLVRRYSFEPYWLQAVPCVVGFACGLVWVAIIADEIVSITQALGLMLGLSEEILGLTVVGFGNSLGDLVTNLTLTRMGYPMMAVSACFGGPMLYILLGIGIAACGVMTRPGHVGDTYWIPITSPTVLVSTACLLANSILYLVAVPLQGFQMTRMVGLISLCIYVMGMSINVYLEW
ncbi:hypothetical protein GGI25_001287 [Coemansia spiralis]|uniref:Sodium/calcium exchanger membrane region domain-containing protein n=2 Tax=Coemansia TaxID=4863 RepID=A0A9W8G671_9FUNG|nr:hypothetical protein EDC05_001149 [Coemansia umbellata]KAJ2619232.1 hypothetical protein GGI26_005997 [Coemansia sp. RSA 1358]KAJ2679597.1 hypothetical protein GGI25_001287 [Coemansia spiralis]